MIGSQNWQQVLVFTRTKHRANRLTEQLKKDGLKSAAIHGNKSQNARTKALNQFKEGKVRVLVATDIAARGLDIQQLPHVVNYELPHVPEDYVHRIGRTGRAGNEGLAVSLVSGDEKKLLRDIERLLKRKIDQEIWQGYEPMPQSRNQSRNQASDDDSNDFNQQGRKRNKSASKLVSKSANGSSNRSARRKTEGSAKGRRSQNTDKSRASRFSADSGNSKSSNRRRRRSSGSSPEFSASESSGTRSFRSEQPRSLGQQRSKKKRSEQNRSEQPLLERSRPGKRRSSNERSRSKRSDSYSAHSNRSNSKRGR